VFVVVTRIGMASLGGKMDQARRQRQAVEAIIETGGGNLPQCLKQIP
jgi:hypothetical protein